MRIIRAMLLGIGPLAALAIPVAAVLSWPRDSLRVPAAGAAANQEVWTCSMHPQV